MEYMFSDCSSLESLDFVKKIDITKVEIWYDMFNNCDKLPKKTREEILGENK